MPTDQANPGSEVRGIGASDARRPQVSVIVPTLNEAENLPALVTRIAAALAGWPYEILIVDDSSPDRTAEVCAELARAHPLRLIVRPATKEGLSGAVLQGMALARGEFLVVMDADLQHPPEQIPQLLAPLERGEADFVIGSRYTPGGTTQEQWGALRRMNSWLATLLARPFSGRVQDPMSGFFALKRQTYEGAERLTPLGYKIGLELMCKARVGRVREVPIHFGTRKGGRSKLTLKQQFRYLEHLSRLYDFTYPRASPIVKFLIATTCAWVAGLVLFVLWLHLGIGRALAAPGAYAGAILVTAVFHLRYVHTQREFIVRRRPWKDFLIISFGELVACAALAKWATARVPELPLAEFFLLTFGGATVVKYILRKELLQDIRGIRKRED
jgi:dolichol-phosphate mannosyltransferase